MKTNLFLLLSLGLLILAPSGLASYEVSVLTLALTYVILTTGLNVVTGYCGQFSFAQAAFYGIGAYTTAIMIRDFQTGFWFNLMAGTLVATVSGLLMGIPALRLRGHFLAIVSIAFQTVVYLTLVQWIGFTGGQNGIQIPAVGPLSVFGIPLGDVTGPVPQYYLTLALAAVLVIVALRLVRSRIGREWMAVRDDEHLAQAVGIDTTRAKLSAFLVSAGFAGVAGVLNAYALRGVTPDDYTIFVSSIVVAMLIVGGRGTFLGPIIGAFALTIIPESFGEFSRYKMLLFGLVLLVFASFLPMGLAGFVNKWKEART